MDEKELLHSIQSLKDIKPRQEWVLLTRQRILGDAVMPKKSFSFDSLFNVFSVLKYLERPAFILPALAVLVFGGIVARASGNSLPGDMLYSLKAAVENVQVNMTSDEQKPYAHLELAEKRLEDLKKIGEENKVKNLSSTIKAFENNVSETSKALTELVEKEPAKALQLSRQVIQLQKEKTEVEKVLGTAIAGKETEELESATKSVIENELKDLETRTLSEKQAELFAQAREAYEAQDFSTSLELIWTLANPVEE